MPWEIMQTRDSKLLVYIAMTIPAEQRETRTQARRLGGAGRL